jgi:hypothetical protein
MGSQTQHEVKARGIADFVAAIGPLNFPEWEAVGLFYQALHLIEGMLAVKGRHAANHNERRDILKSEFPEILKQYRPIENFSVLCRYRFMGVTKAQVQSHLVPRLAQLTRYLELEIREG